MAKIQNSTLKAEAKRLCDKKRWEADSWTAEDSATAAIRTVLLEMGCKEVLGDEHKEARKAVLAALLPLFTAPINFQRTYLVPEGLAPEKAAAKAATLGEDV